MVARIKSRYDKGYLTAFSFCFPLVQLLGRCFPLRVLDRFAFSFSDISAVPKISYL